MKKKLQKLVALAAAALLTGFAQQADASHWMGSDLTYMVIAPNIYSVDLKLYRDCSGASATASATLNIKSPGCNAGRNINMTKLGSNQIGNQYCPSITPTCIASGFSNYEVVTFRATVTFSAAEQACPEWIMSWSECCRPSSANLPNASGFGLYTEAMVRLGNNLHNSSPEFSPLNVPIPFVNHNQPIQISMNAYEQDGDSLVYSLVNPLDNATTPIAFGMYPAGIVFNSDSTKWAGLPGGTFSATYPIISYHIDWNMPNPITPLQKFMFDSQTGTVGFIPNKYEDSPSMQGKNKYVMVVQIDEYRKVNGAMVKVGYIRRDMFINVINCGSNQNPNVNSPVVNGQPISETTIINLRPGTPMNLQFNTADGNAADVLQLQSDVANVLSGASFNKTTSAQPTATVTWTPTASHVSNRIYYFNVTVQDNACPVKGYQTHTFGVRVSATGGVTGTSENLTANAGFSVYPNPFSQELHFKLNLKTKAESIRIYNLLGQQIDQVSVSNFGLGEQQLTWKNAHKFAAGSYVAKLISADKTVQTLKFTKLQ